MKKIIALILALVMICATFCVLTACNDKKNDKKYFELRHKCVVDIFESYFLHKDSFTNARCFSIMLVINIIHYAYSKSQPFLQFK